MTIDPKFANRAREFGAALAEDLRQHPEIRNYSGADWANHRSSVREQFGAMGVDLLRWMVGVIRVEHPIVDLTADDPTGFNETARHIIQNLPAFRKDAVNVALSDSDYSLFFTQAKDDIIMPALFPNRGFGSRGWNRGHLTPVE